MPVLLCLFNHNYYVSNTCVPGKVWHGSYRQCSLQTWAVPGFDFRMPWGSWVTRLSGMVTHLPRAQCPVPAQDAFHKGIYGACVLREGAPRLGSPLGQRAGSRKINSPTPFRLPRPRVMASKQSWVLPPLHHPKPLDAMGSLSAHPLPPRGTLKVDWLLEKQRNIKWYD